MSATRREAGQSAARAGAAPARKAGSTRRAEHVADTRQALVDAARKLFTEQGFVASGTEEIVAEARVTRGALYHHFRDKTDLFRAVMEQVAREVAEDLVASGLAATSAAAPAGAWEEIRDGLRAFLDLCVVTDDFQRIVLVEGPAVLGHEAWDGLVAEFGSNLLAQWLSRAIDEGAIAPVPVQPLTRLMIAMIAESSLYIARAEDRPAARVAVGVAMDRLLNGLACRLALACRVGSGLPPLLAFCSNRS